MAPRPVGTSSARVRAALHLLGELDAQLRHLGLVTPERYALVRLLAATRRQLWLAVAALESKPRGLLGVAGMIWVPVVAWPARALSFLARSLWRSTRAVLRLVYMLRVLWP